MVFKSLRSLFLFLGHISVSQMIQQGHKCFMKQKFFRFLLFELTFMNVFFEFFDYRSLWINSFCLGNRNRDVSNSLKVSKNYSYLLGSASWVFHKWFIASSSPVALWCRSTPYTNNLLWSITRSHKCFTSSLAFISALCITMPQVVREEWSIKD